MVIPKYSTASAAEILRLKALVKRIDQAKAAPTVTANAPEPGPAVAPNPPSIPGETQRATNRLFRGGLQHVEISREPLKIDNPVELLLILMPELTPYRWQFETLMQIGGYLTIGEYKPWDRTEITAENPFQLVLPAANGSGKDAVLIAATAVWFALTGARNRVIITSSSFEQIKFQTEPGVRELVNRANKQFNGVFKSVQFHHIVPELGSEIKLFATDDAGHAEGYHSWHGGKLMCIVNEAKSVKEDIFEAISRWRGVAYKLLVSSPGKRSGYMFNRIQDAICYPAPAVLGKYYYRRVTAYECPHIHKTVIDTLIREYGADSPLVMSSVNALFSDFNEPVIISVDATNKLQKFPPPHRGSDIGIGFDIAGGGDEDAVFVRKGNKVIYAHFFRQADTDIAADIVDLHLVTWKDADYIFNADNGGMGQAVIDKLVTRGWKINRRNNQSPAFNKRMFLNLGAEMWYHVKRLIERGDIILPVVDKLIDQLTTRQYRNADTTQGKVALESKQTARANGRPSPDRADAFVLCFHSYRPNGFRDDIAPEKGTRPMDTKELLAWARRGLPVLEPMTTTSANQTSGRFTLLNSKL